MGIRRLVTKSLRRENMKKGSEERRALSELIVLSGIRTYLRTRLDKGISRGRFVPYTDKCDVAVVFWFHPI